MTCCTEYVLIFLYIYFRSILHQSKNLLPSLVFSVLQLGSFHSNDDNDDDYDDDDDNDGDDNEFFTYGQNRNIAL